MNAATPPCLIPQRVLLWGIALALVAWMVAVVSLAQVRLTPTFDEQNHVTRGISVLRTGDYRLVYHHPPAANLLQGLLVAWAPGTRFVMEPAWGNPQDIWPAARATIWERSADGVRIIQRARAATLLFLLLLGLVAFLWARDLFGPWAGALALALVALDPNLLAHGGLATTDLPATATFALALYLLRRYLLRPGRGRLLAAGAAIGLALATKFSALLLVPLTGLFLLIALFTDAGPWWPRLLRAAGRFALLGLIAGVVVWACYGFRVEPLGSKAGQPLPANASALDRVPVPALQYLRGVKAVATEAEGHRAYLLGQADTTGKGWWYYFPVAIAAKTPLPELLAILGMPVLLALPRARSALGVAGRELPFLLIPAGLYLAAALGLFGISLNLGIRHILPLSPLLLILAGGWAVFAARRRALAAVLLAGLGLQLASVLRAYPDFLSYFNEAAGGPARGYRILVDSNYDWGQDLGALAAWQREHGIAEIGLSYFGTTP
ncbi:MAG TPA: glycosyltransferase family 39 protein, partial [Armatimonadota bacterium]|nr:glycosyltransferase family 39 protein [Armatimonadota bacterium]